MAWGARSKHFVEGYAVCENQGTIAEFVSFRPRCGIML